MEALIEKRSIKNMGRSVNEKYTRRLPAIFTNFIVRRVFFARQTYVISPVHASGDRLLDGLYFALLVYAESIKIRSELTTPGCRTTYPVGQAPHQMRLNSST
jgi:hypothetical protein